MFRRFTDSARAVVVAARDYARSEQAAEIREEHLLAALLDAPTTGPLLARLGVADEQAAPVLEEIRAARRRGGLSAVDAQALADLGVDLDAVLTRVETELGVGALDETRHRGGRRSRRSMLSAGSRCVLQGGLRQAAARRDRELREEHLLLGLVAQRSLVADALGARGVTVATVLAAVGTPPVPGSAS